VRDSGEERAVTEHEHEGSFAEGEEREEHHPEEEKRDFAEGQEDEHHEHEGTFAEGQEGDERHPEGGPHGDFARGEKSASREPDVVEELEPDEGAD
jgi:hypothetical protein